jgi:hypothetical protein
VLHATRGLSLDGKQNNILKIIFSCIEGTDNLECESLFLIFFLEKIKSIDALLLVSQIKGSVFFFFLNI